METDLVGGRERGGERYGQTERQTETRTERQTDREKGGLGESGRSKMQES